MKPEVIHLLFPKGWTDFDLFFRSVLIDKCPTPNPQPDEVAIPLTSLSGTENKRQGKTNTFSKMSVFPTSKGHLPL